MHSDPHPHLEEIEAAILRELRLEAEEAEREAAASAAMRRSLQDVARELMGHGDTVSAGIGGWTFTGRIRHVAADIVSLEVAGSRVDLNLAAVTYLSPMQRSPTGGTGGSRIEAPSLRARLLEHRLNQDPVEIGISGSDDALPGRIATVAIDHLVLADPERRREWFIPLSAVGFMRTASAEWRE